MFRSQCLGAPLTVLQKRGCNVGTHTHTGYKQFFQRIVPWGSYPTPPTRAPREWQGPINKYCRVPPSQGLQVIAKLTGMGRDNIFIICI